MSHDPSFDELNKLYQSLGEVRADFRNYNMYQMLIAMFKGKTHLDIGSGAGHLLHFSKVAGFQVTGVEPNHDLIDYSHKLYGDLNIHALYADRLDTLNDTFDTITLIDVLEHIQDDSGTLAKLRNLLMPDGQVVILVPQYPHLYGKRDKSIGHFRRYTRKELIQKLRDQGFEVTSVRCWNLIGYLPYLLSEKVFQKPPSVKSRKVHKKSSPYYWLNKGFDLWFRYVENPVSFGWGLSLIVTAKKR